MSGRATRALISTLLLLGALVAASIMLPPASATLPTVSLNVVAKNWGLCTGPVCATGVSTVAGASTLVTLYLASGGGNDFNVTQASCNSVALTRLANFTTGSFGAVPADFSRMYFFYGVGFEPGSITCGINVVRLGIAGTNVFWALYSWSNVNQAAPIAQHTQATGTTQLTYSASLSQVPASTHVIADFVTTCCQLNIPTPNGAQTERFAQFYSGSNYAKGSTKPGGGTATMSWTVSAANDAWGLYVIDVAPVGPITDTFTYTASGLIATFTSFVSGGAGGPYNTTWEFGDGQISYSANPVHTYALGGTFVAFLNVTDAGSNTASASTSVIVAPAGTETPPPPPPPLPPSTITYPSLVNLNCGVVTFSDPRGDAAVSSTVLWAYNFGDGSPIDYSPVPGVTHTYAYGGIYDATMTTQDKQGNVQTYGITVDTTPTGCAGAVVRGLAPPTFFGLFVALLVASLVAGRKHPKWRRRLRTGSLVSFGVVIFVVVVL